MSKDIWIEVYDEMVAEFAQEMGIDEWEAYDRLWQERPDEIHNRYADRIGSMIDHARLRHKEGKL